MIENLPRELAENYTFVYDSYTLVYSAIIGAIISGLVGILVFKVQDNLRFRSERSNFAKIFHSEIEGLEQQYIIPIIKSQYFYARSEVAAPNYFDSLIKEMKLNIDTVQSLYDDKGLYFVFFERIFLFDKDVYQKILEFYRLYLLADEYTKKYINTAVPDEKWDTQDKIYQNITRCQPLAAEIKQALKRYF